MEAVRVDQVSKRYGSLQALDHVSFSIQEGEFFGLLGPNGAGKSTLISALAGLIRVDTGSLAVLGADVRTDFRLARRHLGVVPQEVVIDPFFTVRETLQFQSGYFGIRNNAQWIDQLLTNLNLLDKADTNLRKLSGGMKRRVLIAQALVHKPRVLVLDEPTAGVDVELRQSMWKFVKQLHAQGTTVVLTTHYLEEAEALCDRIAIIDAGQIVALESKQALLARGLGSKLLIKTRLNIASVPTTLQERIIRCNANELELTLHRDQDSVMEILDQLRVHGLEIIFVSVVNDNLEDVFVQMTGKQPALSAKV